MGIKDAKKKRKFRVGKFFLGIIAVFFIFLTLFVLINLTGIGVAYKLALNTNKVTSERDQNSKPKISINKKQIKPGEFVWQIVTTKEESKVDTDVTENAYLKVLQLTDIHIGSGFISIEKDRQAFDACREMVKWAKPDLIVITGDAIYPVPLSANLNNKRAMEAFATMMDKLEIPWTFVFGNHDTESYATASKKQISDFLQTREYNPKEGKYCLYLPGKQFAGGKNDTPMGNYTIEIYKNSVADANLVHSMIFVDTNKYAGNVGLFNYDRIHDDQTAWYQGEVERLKNINNSAYSSLYFHIPLSIYRTTWEKLVTDKRATIDNYTKIKIKNGPTNGYYYGGDMQEFNKDGKLVISSVSEADPKHNDFYEKLAKAGHTKFLFCGHDHDNSFSLETIDGVRLTYSKSIDYLAYFGINKRVFQRGGTLMFVTGDSANNGKNSLRIYAKKLVNKENNIKSSYNEVRDKLEFDEDSKTNIGMVP